MTGGSTAQKLQSIFASIIHNHAPIFDRAAVLIRSEGTICDEAPVYAGSTTITLPENCGTLAAPMGTAFSNALHIPVKTDSRTLEFPTDQSTILHLLGEPGAISRVSGYLDTEERIASGRTRFISFD